MFLIRPDAENSAAGSETGRLCLALCEEDLATTDADVYGRKTDADPAVKTSICVGRSLIQQQVCDRGTSAYHP